MKFSNQFKSPFSLLIFKSIFIFFRILKNQNPNINTYSERIAAIKTSNLQKKWLEGEITTFEYLMEINFYSGRSLNDLTQYPVFPWVLAEFESNFLDLNDEEQFYRKLNLPIGAINEKRLSFFKQRRDSLGDVKNKNN